MKYRYTKFTGDAARRSGSRGSGVEAVRPAAVERVRQPVRAWTTTSGRCRRCTTRFSMRCSTAACCRKRRIERLLGDPADADQADARSKLEELIQQIIERMAEQGYITTPPDLDAERERRQGRGGARARPAGAGQVRSHRQDAGFSRLPRAARSARLARQEQLRPPRHARAGDRRRDDRRAEAVRIRRHAEPRRRRDAAERGAAADTRRTASQHRRPAST